MKKISVNIFGCFEIQAALRLARSFLVLFYASFSLYAADGTRFWKNIGPEGANINHFITSQHHPEIIYSFHQNNYDKTIMGWRLAPPNTIY